MLEIMDKKHSDTQNQIRAVLNADQQDRAISARRNVTHGGSNGSKHRSSKQVD